MEYCWWIVEYINQVFAAWTRFSDVTHEVVDQLQLSADTVGIGIAVDIFKKASKLSGERIQKPICCVIGLD